MNKKKKILISVILLLMIIFGFISYFNSNKPKPRQEDSVPIVQNTAIDSVTLEVSGKKYETKINEGMSVYDAMNEIEKNKENNFSFTYKEYPGLGIFIDSINGVVGSPGKYWIYYVNGKKATIGISVNKLKNGDIINWKQE